MAPSFGANQKNLMIGKALLLSLIPCASLFAQDPVTIALEPFASGLSGPVDLAHCGDERLFVVEQAGRIKIIAPDGTVSTTPFLDITTRVNDSGNEQGLLGLAFDPDYTTTGIFYVNYTGGTGNGESRISRFRVTEDPNVADPESEEIIYTVTQPYSNHNGGDVEFGPDGYLYVGFGDGGSADDPNNNAQTLTNDALGDMIRIDVRNNETYTIPPTNPWVGAGNDTLPEIWASGLRNPFRFGFDALTGDLWIGDVGQNAWEEVDVWPAGDNSGPNFGWRCREGAVVSPTSVTTGCPPASAFVEPVSVHDHDNESWCSVIGGRVYRGAEFPRLSGRYIYTDYCPTPYYSLLADGSGGYVREQISTNNGGFGTACIAENNTLELFVTNETTGTIKRIVDQCPMDPPSITADGVMLTSSEGDSYTWYLDGEAIEGATTQTIEALANGSYTVSVELNNGLCELTSAAVEVGNVGIGGVDLALFGIHPSPARELIYLTGVHADLAALQVLDMSGRVVATRSLTGQRAVTMDVSDLATGMYMIRLASKEGTMVQQRAIQVQH